MQKFSVCSFRYEIPKYFLLIKSKNLSSDKRIIRLLFLFIIFTKCNILLYLLSV